MAKIKIDLSIETLHFLYSMAKAYVLNYPPSNDKEMWITNSELVKELEPIIEADIKKEGKTLEEYISFITHVAGQAKEFAKQNFNGPHRPQ